MITFDCSLGGVICLATRDKNNFLISIYEGSETGWHLLRNDKYSSKKALLESPESLLFSENNLSFLLKNKILAFKVNSVSLDKYLKRRLAFHLQNFR